MDKKTRNLELESWLIETTGEEMMANHLGPNWNRFNDEFGFYPNMSMTIADLVWQHQQAKVEELQKQLIDQGQIFNEQAQLVKDLEHKVKCEREISLFADKLCCELQKRVDKALEKIDRFYKDGCLFHEWIVEAEQALNGGEQ